MADILLAIAVCTIPVVGIVVLALSGRTLSKSCGGVGPGSGCSHCGRTGNDIPVPGQAGTSRASSVRTCPAGESTHR